jgi:hypothetical protein
VPTDPPHLAHLSLNQRRFLTAYALCGNLTHAAELVGLTRQCHYLWSGEDPGYVEAFKTAQEESVERLEEEARRRAMAGSDLLLIFLLKSLRPAKYRDNHHVLMKGSVEHGGKVDHGHRPVNLHALVESLPAETVTQLLAAIRAQRDGATAATPEPSPPPLPCGLVELPPAEPTAPPAAEETPEVPAATQPPPRQPTQLITPATTPPGNGNGTPPPPNGTGRHRPVPSPTFGVDERLWTKVR